MCSMASHAVAAGKQGTAQLPLAHCVAWHVALQAWLSRACTAKAGHVEVHLKIALEMHETTQGSNRLQSWRAAGQGAPAYCPAATHRPCTSRKKVYRSACRTNQ